MFSKPKPDLLPQPRIASLIKKTGFCLAAVFALASMAEGQVDFSVEPFGVSAGGVPTGGPFDPPGTLYDNGQSDGVIAIGSQNGDNFYTARAADDFSIASGSCPSGRFDVETVRMHLAQTNTSPQPFEMEIYEDDGTGTSPSPADAIDPIATIAEATQISLGVYDPGVTIFEVTSDTPGLTLLGDTTYWISGLGTNNSLNSLGFENFFASSDGATGTSPNGVFINPGRLSDLWTRVELLAPGPPLHFSFAIDGSCKEAFFSDGFESGGTDAWDAVVP